jgi:ribose 5-phosphate isomerase B
MPSFVGHPVGASPRGTVRSRMTGEDCNTVTARDPNIESDVRAIVQRIVDGLFDGDADDPRAVSASSDSPRGGADPTTASSADSKAADPGEMADAAPRSDVGTIAIGGDHGGFALKERLGFRLKEQGFVVLDCGTDSTEAVDYPDIAAAVARHVADGAAVIGIIVDGAGIGSCMAANKVHGVRAAMCHDLSTARNAREHNHANVLTLGAGLIGDALAWQITQEFIATAYGPGRHAMRVDKINELERLPAGAAR